MDGIRQFHTLAEAIAFISECVERDSALELFNQTTFAEKQAEKFATTSDFFSQFIFPPLVKQFQVMDFRIRYQDSAFPETGDTFKLGGHDKELGHMHLDFSRRGKNWVIEGVWQCR